MCATGRYKSVPTILCPLNVVNNWLAGVRHTERDCARSAQNKVNLAKAAQLKTKTHKPRRKKGAGPWGLGPEPVGWEPVGDLQGLSAAKWRKIHLARIDQEATLSGTPKSALKVSWSPSSNIEKPIVTLAVA